MRESQDAQQHLQHRLLTVRSTEAEMRLPEEELRWLAHPTEVWAPCTLTSSPDADPLTFKTDNGESLTYARGKLANLPLVQIDQLQGVEDICSLTSATEGALLHTVRIRYYRREIYTRVARTLIAVNPFAPVSIYSVDVMEKYHRAFETLDLPPHIFAIGADALKGLRERENDQAVLISGESGAGKTESAKLILSFVADGTAGAATSSGIVQDKVMRTNPVLEAFGNAMTARNNNSSRFGKWIDLRFSPELEILGSSMTSYLLETTRVTGQGTKERGFHVFFQLLAMKQQPEFQHLHLEDPKKFRFLKNGQSKAPGINDAESFHELVDALSVLGFEGDRQAEIFKILAGLLWLGNIDFAEARDPSTARSRGRCARVAG